MTDTTNHTSRANPDGNNDPRQITATIEALYDKVFAIPMQTIVDQWLEREHDGPQRLVAGGRNTIVPAAVREFLNPGRSGNGLEVDLSEFEKTASSFGAGEIARNLGEVLRAEIKRTERGESSSPVR